MPSNSQPFAQVQASGYSPALQRKKISSVPSNSHKLHGWMTEPAAPSAAATMKYKDFASSATFHYPRQPANTPQSILVKPEAHKTYTDKVMFDLTNICESQKVHTVNYSYFCSSTASKVGAVSRRWRLSSSKTSHLLLVFRNSAPPQLSSRTLAFRGVGPVAHHGKRWTGDYSQRRKRSGSQERAGNVHLRPKSKPTETTTLAAIAGSPVSSVQPCQVNRIQTLFHTQIKTSDALYRFWFAEIVFLSSRSRVTTTHLAQMDSELTLLQGEVVLVHRPRPDGRVLVTQESSGQTALFHSSILQALERLSWLCVPAALI